MRYTVYTKGEHQVGFVNNGGSWQYQTSDGEAKALPFAEISRKLGALLKKGYVVNPALVFWDKRAGAFSRAHPDLASGGHDWILSAEPPDLIEAVDLVTQRMLACADADVLMPEEIHAWKDRQLQNESLIVAFRDMPAWALLIGETALEKGWLIRSQLSLGVMPRDVPSRAPQEWDQWLAQSYPVDDVISTRTKLGLSIGRALQTSPILIPDANDDLGLMGI